MLAPGFTLGVPATPFFTGGVAGTHPGRYTVSLGGFEYVIDTRKYVHSSVDTLRDGVVQTGQADDRLFDVRGAWARYRSSWHHGAGQVLADLDDEEMDAYRFNTSYSINTWNRNQLTLHRDVTARYPLAGTGNRMAVAGGYLFGSNGTELLRTADGTTYTAVTAPGGDIHDLASDGSTLYVGTSTGLYRYTAGATTTLAFSSPVSGAVHHVAFVAGRLLAGKANMLQEISSTGAVATTVKTHFQADFRWTAVFALGSRIYLGGHASGRSEIYTAEVDNTGALVTSSEATMFLPNELVRDVLPYAGAVLIVTSFGFRLAQVGNDGSLTYGALIDAVGDSHCVTGDGRYAWVGWSSYPGGGAGLARIALDEFVEPLVPAYASDLHHQGAGTVIACAYFNGGVHFVIEGNAIYSQATVYETAGELDAGRFYFGTVENKGVSNLEAAFAPLVAGETVRITVYDESGETIATRSTSTVGDTVLTIDIGAAIQGWTRIVVRLTGTGATTPTLYRWRLRAYPIVPFTQQWVLPLILASRVKIGGGEGQARSYDVQTEIDRVVTWARTKEPVVQRIGARGERVRVDAFKVEDAKWGDDGRTLECTMLVQTISV